jgi:tetratricopeptide (TPR) repeat protein
VVKALLLQYYNDLPEPRDGEEHESWAKRLAAPLKTFKKKVSARYTEGTLQRLLDCSDSTVRQAAVLALGMLGTMDSNEPLAGLLKDEELRVRQLAADALWALWFRADSEANNRELQRVLRLTNPEAAKGAFEILLKKAPNFAEAYNQRAILFFRHGDFQNSAADCERVLKLNPFHFGALGGLAQCYMKLRKPKAALKAFRAAYRLNPDLGGIKEAIRALEEMLGEEGKKDDKK